MSVLQYKYAGDILPAGILVTARAVHFVPNAIPREPIFFKRRARALLSPNAFPFGEIIIVYL